MSHRFLELLELPMQVLGAIGVIFAGSVTGGGLALLAQLPGAAAGVVTEAPTWFLAFVAAVVIALAWACLTLARYAAVTQNTSNEQIKASMDQQTRVLTNLASTIERQNMFWERAGISAITRMTEAPEETCSPLSSSPRSRHPHPTNPQ